MDNPLDSLPPPGANPLDSLAPPTTDWTTPAAKASMLTPGNSPVAHTDPTSANPVENELSVGLQNALPAYGKWLTDRWLGAKQIMGLAGTQEAADKREIDAPLQASFGGGLGQTAAAGITTLPLGVGRLGYLGAMAIGGALGATDPVVEGESRAQNAGVGALLGAGGQFVGNRIGNWLTARGSLEPLTPGQAQAAQAGANLGLQTTPGQATGNRSLQQLEAAFSSNPWSSGPFNRLAQSNRRITARAVAGAMGENANTVDSTVLQNASDRLGDVFDRVRDPSRISVVNPADTTSALDAIDQNYLGTFANNSSTVRDNPLVAQLESLTSQGGINGEQLGSLSSNLGRAANNQMTSAGGDRQLGQALYDVQGHVHDLIQGQLSGDELAQYTQALQQYRALRQVTSRVGNVNPTTGDVSPVSLANYLQQTDRQGFTFGRNQSDMYTAARFGQAFKPVVGDSGTATRSWNPFSIAMGIPRSILSNAYMSPIGSAVVRGSAAAASATAPPLALGRAVQPYLTGGLPGAATLVPYLTE